MGEVGTRTYDMSGKSFSDMMIDIETMGEGSDAAIVSIAAVEFNIETGECGRELSLKVSLQSGVSKGMVMDPSTVLWWMRQSDEARAKITDNDGLDLVTALNTLSHFIEDSSRRAPINVWANSPRFDLGILQTAYKKIGCKIPWDFRRERDLRTLESFAPQIRAHTLFEGTPHDPLDDCKHQIKYCCDTWSYIKDNKNK